MKFSLNDLAANKNIFLAVMLSSFIVPFSGIALILSLPDIGKDYGIGAGDLGWVLEVFLLTSVILLLPMAKLADKFGKKHIFFLGIVIFTAASILALFLPGYTGLLLARFLQAVGAAMLFATGTAIIALIVPRKHRGQAMGWNIAMVNTGLSLGPVLGGFLNYYAGWRSLFFIFSLLGIFTALYAKGSLQQDWKNITGRSNSLPWQLLSANRFFSFSLLTALLSYSATFAVSFLLSLYLQTSIGFSSREAGLLLLIQPVIMILLSPKTGALSDKYSPALLCSWGMGIIAISLLEFACSVYLGSFPAIIPGLLLLGGGFALFSAPNNNAIMGSVEKQHYSFASSLLGFSRMAGQMLSMSFVTLLLSLQFTDLPAENTLDFKIIISLLLFAVLCICGIFASLTRQKDNSHG